MFTNNECLKVLPGMIRFSLLGVALFLLSPLPAQAEAPGFVAKTNVSNSAKNGTANKPGQSEYRIKRMSLTTEIADVNGVKYKRVRNIPASVVVIEWRGEEITYTGNEVVHVLRDKGLFSYIEGVGFAVKLSEDKSAEISEKGEQDSGSSESSAGGDTDMSSGGGSDSGDADSGSTEDSGETSSGTDLSSGGGSQPGSQASRGGRGSSGGGKGQSGQQPSGGGKPADLSQGQGGSRPVTKPPKAPSKTTDDGGIDLLGQDFEADLDNRDPNANIPSEDDPNQTGVWRGEDMRKRMEQAPQEGETASGSGTSEDGSSDTSREDPAHGHDDLNRQDSGGGGGSSQTSSDFENPLSGGGE